MATISTTADKDKEKNVESLSFAVLQEISSKLNSVAERVESKLEAMEKRCTPSSSSDARTPKQKRVIPHTLRVRVSDHKLHIPCLHTHTCICVLSLHWHRFMIIITDIFPYIYTCS